MSRRFTSRVAFCIVAGASTAIAIASACAWFRPASARDDSFTFGIDSRRDTWMGWSERGPGWSMHMLYGAGGVTEEGMKFTTELPSWIDTPGEGAIDQRAIAAVGAGWPMVCVVASCEGLGHQDPKPGQGWQTGLGPQWVEWRQWKGAIGGEDANGPTAPPYQKVLPFGIAPLGTIVNIAFWSALWSIPFVLIAMRRWRRLRRGCCGACGYDLRGTDHKQCPECGSRLHIVHIGIEPE